MSSPVALDASGASPSTIIEATGALQLDDSNDTDSNCSHASSVDPNTLGNRMSEMNGGALSPTSEAPTVSSAPFPANLTKVYYNVDDEGTPYLSEVHVPPELITLGDFKRVLTRSNFKFYSKTIDPDSGFEVKAELRDDMQRLERSPNGRFELFLLTTEGSAHGSDGGSSILQKGPRHHMVPGPAPSGMHYHPHNYKQAVHQYDTSMFSTDSESTFSQAIPNYLRGSLNRRPAPQQFLQGGHRGAGRRFDPESTLGSESDARMFSDDDDRGSTTTDFTSVSRQQENVSRRRRSRRQHYRKPSRASSFSSITESSMSLDVLTVTLNMDTVNFLGISIVGQSSARGDNGIYVANIMKGGAVALDGRIEANDMILQVNDISFENFTNDQAVDVLRDAVARKGPIKLTVAKCFENGPKNCFTVPRNRLDEPVRPIDTQAWIQHTNAMRGMPSILEGSEGAPTPIPGDYGHPAMRPPSSSTVTSGSQGGQGTVVTQLRLDIHTDKKKVVEVMSMPGSGLDFKDRQWLKISIPMSFLGNELVNWLLLRVDGLLERKDARRYAAELLQRKYIAHAVNKSTFMEQCYYVLGEECAEFARFRVQPDETHVHGAARSQPGHAGQWQWTAGQTVMPPQGGGKPPQANSMVSGYASMPVSPFPHPHYGSVLPSRPAQDLHSQASGHSGEGSGSGSDHKRPGRTVVIPPAPSTMSQGQGPSHQPGRLDDLPQDLAASRQSFRMAMNQPCEFFIDNL